MKIIYQEQSQTTPTGKVVVAFFLTLILGWAGYSVYQSVTKQIFLVADLFLVALALYFLFKHAGSTYTYTLTEKDFIVTEKNILGKRDISIPYEDIDGIGVFTFDLFRRIKIRYKHRMASSMDNRQMLMLVYSVTTDRVKHGRILLKVSQAFLDELDAIIPGKVGLTLNEVSFHALIREEAYRLGYSDVATYKADLKSGKLDDEEE